MKQGRDPAEDSKCSDPLEADAVSTQGKALFFPAAWSPPGQQGVLMS